MVEMIRRKKFIIGFRGTDNFTTIQATNLKNAKTKFAQLHGIRVNSYITSRKKARSAKDLLENRVFR